MGTDSGIKIDYEAMGRFLRGSESEALVSRYGAQVAGEKYGWSVHDSGERMVCNVFGARGEEEENGLLKALGNAPERPHP